MVFLAWLAYRGFDGRAQKCGLQTCHGLEVSCGPDIIEACTAIYMEGDRCLELVRCDVVGSECQQVDQEPFLACKDCVESCKEKYGDDEPDKFFECEFKCGE